MKRWHYLAAAAAGLAISTSVAYNLNGMGGVQGLWWSIAPSAASFVMGVLLYHLKRVTSAWWSRWRRNRYHADWGKPLLFALDGMWVCQSTPPGGRAIWYGSGITKAQAYARWRKHPRPAQMDLLGRMRFYNSPDSAAWQA